MARVSPRPVSDTPTRTSYRRALTALYRSKIPFLVGGGYALAHYAGVARRSKDLDIFIYPRDCDRVLRVLAQAKCQTDFTFSHWLAKAVCGDKLLDIIFSSGNGECLVDDEWFTHAVTANVLGLPVQLCPAEELIWSKAFVQERERYDGADIAHILRVRGAQLAWPRLLQRFGRHWRVLLSHLILFGFAYPSDRAQIPDWVMQELLYRLQHELHSSSADQRVCQGTLLSREQYLLDVSEWGYQDGRLLPQGHLTQEEVARWTAAIAEQK